MTFRWKNPLKSDPKPPQKPSRARERQLELIIPPRTARYSVAVETACEKFKKRMEELKNEKRL